MADMINNIDNDMENLSVKSSSKNDSKNNNSNNNSKSDSDKSDEQKDSNKNNTGKAINKLGHVGNALHTGHSFTLMSNLAMMFKMMLLSAVGAISAAATAIVGAIFSAINAVVSFAVGVVTTIASFIGASVMAVATTLGTIVTCICVAIVSVVAGMGPTEVATREVAPPTVDCSVNVENMMAKFSGDIDAQTVANAQKIYSVYKSMGFDDVQIAGVLGVWQYESHLDPTSIEAIFDEPFAIGPKKQKAIDVGFMTSKYVPDYDYQYDFPAGIGLSGFTATANTELREYAKSKNKNWYDLDIQIAYAIDVYYYGKNWFKTTYKSTKYTDINTATNDFLRTYARGAEDTKTLPDRQKFAEKWYALMGEWSIDANYANSVLALIDTAGDNNQNTVIGRALEKCKSSMTYDNSSLASAAVSYAYEKKEEGIGNDGTLLYRTVHDNVYPGDPWYQSCDRGVACAVRWSGTDDNYPAGSVQPQIDYVVASDRWTEVNWDGNMESLQPGDVIFEGLGAACNGHTLLYVGNEIIAAKYPKAAGTTYCLVSASFEERSPGCQEWYGGGDNPIPRRVFRNVKKQENPQYLNAGAGAN